ncbi:hypothetical protein JST97_34715 [bacterium]|nr:hypothetical protein [bacterium]
MAINTLGLPKLFSPASNALFQMGKSLGMALGSAGGSDLLDGYQGMPGMDEQGAFPLGAGLANPMMGMGQLSQMNPQALFALGSMLGQLMGSMASAGSQGPCLGGFQGGCPMGGPQGMGGTQALGAPQGQAGGQTIELQKGQSYTTPGGATINWPEGGDEVKVSEPGGAQQANRSFGGGNGVNMAASLAGPGYQASLAISLGGTPGALGGATQQAAEDSPPRDWRVWGDPHIDHPNGEKSDFETKNSMFTLQDGSQVIMGADNPKGVVNRVQIVLPGGQPNWDGLDPSQTTVMQDNGKGKFESAGTADRLMQGGFASIPGFA